MELLYFNQLLSDWKRKAKISLRKGGKQLELLLGKWKSKKYTLKLESSDLKRKLVHDVENEKRLRRKVEKDLKSTKNGVKHLQGVVSDMVEGKFQLIGKKKQCTKR